MNTGIRDPMVEARLFHYADKALPGYAGGLWSYRKAGSTEYAVPPEVPTRVDGKLTLGTIGDMGNAQDMTPEAAGLALSAMALNHSLWAEYEQRGQTRRAEFLSEEWERVMEAAGEHPEAGAILWYLD